jgi:hypothetical protein
MVLRRTRTGGRVLRIGTLAAAGAALVLAATANAKLTNVTVSAQAGTPRTHVPWAVTVHVSLRGKPYAKPGYHPTLYLVSERGPPVATFRSTAVGPGTFHVRVVFPRPGTWRYVIPDPLYGEWSFVAPRVVA